MAEGRSRSLGLTCSASSVRVWLDTTASRGVALGSARSVHQWLKYVHISPDWRHQQIWWANSAFIYQRIFWLDNVQYAVIWAAGSMWLIWVVWFAGHHLCNHVHGGPFFVFLLRSVALVLFLLVSDARTQNEKTRWNQNVKTSRLFVTRYLGYFCPMRSCTTLHAALKSEHQAD